MSSTYYNNLWKEAINELLENIHEQFDPLDENLGEKGLKYERKDEEWFRFYAHLYVKYVHCYRILEDCYDQMVHPQKRMLLKDMLESTMLRVVQLKINLIRYNTSTNSVRSQYVNLDEFLLQMRMRPSEIQMHIPRYFVNDQNVDKLKRNQIVDKFLIDLKETNLPEQEIIEERSALDTNMETAIRIIQKIQRGRQGIVRALKAAYYQKREIKKLNKKKQAQGNQNFDFDDSENQKREQVIMIQKTIKGFMARKVVDKVRQEELTFLGIIKKPQNPNDPKTALYKMIKNREKVREIQVDNEKEYKETLGNLKQQLYDKWQEPLKEKMLRDRRLWISETMERNQFSKIPDTVKDYYEKDKVKIPPTPEEQQMMLKLAEAKKKQKGKGKKKKKLTEKDKFQKENPRCGPTEAVLIMQQQIDKHTKEWKDQTSTEDKPELKKIKQTVLPQVQDQIQKMVDDMIELELANLRIKFKKKKGKKKKKKKKKKKAKKIKVPGWKQISKIAPLDQIGHLVDFGVLKKLMPARIKDLIGQPNLLRTKQQLSTQLMPDPSYFDVRQAIVELIGIPLGSQFVKERVDKLHYFLFFGPHGSGKTLIVRGLASECDALVLELSPLTLEPKINDKKELNKMLAMTFNVAKTFPPAIIYMDQVEQIFKGKKKKKKGAGGAAGPNFTKLRKVLTKYKKKVLKKEDRVAVIASTNKMLAMTFNVAKTFPPAIIYMDQVEQIFKGKKKKKKGAGGAAGPNFTKLRKVLTKYKKKVLKKEDRVAVIASTNKPWEMNKKFVKPFAQKKFYFPFPNYATRKALFQHFMQKKGAKLPQNFPITTIAHVTEGYTGGNFRQAINKVVTDRRLLQMNEGMSTRPLQINQFIVPLSNQPSTYIEQYEKFREFNDEVTGIKLRRDKKNAPPEGSEPKDAKKKK